MVLWGSINHKIYDGQDAYQQGKPAVDHIFTVKALAQKYLSNAGGRFY